MSTLISLQNISKSFGTKSLFKDFTYAIKKGERVGIIGPNGSGKSSLLKIISALDDVDSGQVSRSRGLVISSVSQNFEDLHRGGVQSFIDSFENSAQIQNYLDQLSFYKNATSDSKNNDDRALSGLSGGQKKKLQLAISLSQDSDLILLDEPSNHLDIDSIQKLEKILSSRSEAVVMISHDRWLLETFSERIIEINKILPNGVFSYDAPYSEYLEKRADYIEALDKSYDTLKNKVRSEVAWLRQGAKARTTKSKHRTDQAHSLIKNLQAFKTMRTVNATDIQFSHSGRKTKDLIECKNVNLSYNGNLVCKDISLLVKQGAKIALLGANGSGKTSLLKLILGEVKPDSGMIDRAYQLSVSYFSQISDFIDPTISLSKALSPDSDTVIFNGNSLHIASWAKKFGFDAHALHQPYESLSGGEKAKVRIAKLLLESPDILLLDEPTNDLDIDTLEVLEESLLQFKGAVLIISHDRFMLNKVCDNFLGLIKGQKPEMFSSYDQWIQYLQNQEQVQKAIDKKAQANAGIGKPKKLSYKDQREYDQIQGQLEKEEGMLKVLGEELARMIDPDDVMKQCEKIGELQKKVDAMYQRWQELEEQLSNS